MTTPSNTGLSLGLDVAPGGQISLTALFRTYVGGSIPLPVSGVTITIAPATGGSPVLGPTAAGIVGTDLATYTYVWAPAASTPPGDYTVTWAASSPSGAAPVVETVTVVRLPAQSPAPGVYATVADYQEETDDVLTPVRKIMTVLRRASEIIDLAAVGAVYNTDSNGMPTSPQVIEVFMRACCAQAQYMLANNDPAGVKDQYTSTNVGGVSLTRAPAATARALPPLAPHAALILRNAGVLPAAPLISW